MTTAQESAAATPSVLPALIAEPQWLRALSRWHRQGGRSLAADAPALGLEPPAWQGLCAQLGQTAWFEHNADGLRPNAGGRELLYRANELIHLMELEARGETPVHLFEQPLRGGAVEIGCGTGYVMRHLARLGFAPLYGYDLSPTALDMARCLLEREGKTAHLLAKDATPLGEVPDRSVALIYSRIALYYFRVPALAQSFARVLLPGARVVAEVKSPRYYLQLLRDLKQRRFRRALSYGVVFLRTLIYEVSGLQPHLGTTSHETGWTARTIRRFARAAGLRLDSRHYDAEHKSHVFVLSKPDQTQRQVPQA